VTPTAVEAEDLLYDLQFFQPKAEIRSLAALENRPFLSQAAGGGAQAERLETLASLASTDGPPVVAICHLTSALRLCPPPESLLKRRRLVTRGREDDFRSLAQFLARNGYNHVGQVESAADYSVRGGLIDVFPAGFNNPLRIEFFGDYVESLRSFRVDDQKSIGQLESVLIPPAAEVERDQETGMKLAEALENLALKKLWLNLLYRPLVEHLRDCSFMADRDNWGSLIYPKGVTIAQYLKGSDCKVVLFEPSKTLQLAQGAYVSLENHFQRLLNEERPSLAIDSLYAEPEAILQALENLPSGVIRASELGLDMDNKSEVIRVKCETNDDLKALMSVPRRASGLLGPLAARVRALLGRRLKVSLISRTKEQSRRLAEMLSDYDLSPRASQEISSLARYGYKDKIFDDYQSQRERKKEKLRGLNDLSDLLDHQDPLQVDGLDLVGRGSLHFEVGQLSTGFVLADLDEAYITDDEIFGAKQRLRRRAASEFRGLKGFSGLKDLSPGDYVVHSEHGVGQYLGLVTLVISSGQKGDFLHLSYKGGDKLYVPVERFSSVSKYVGLTDHPPSLDRLGGASWEKIKSKVKENIRQMAEELLRLYAVRQTAPGHSFSERDNLMMEFESSFEFQETEDQQRAIEEVLADLSSPKPMDRLICGDVGYGKTEVAMRAAFKVVCDQKQAAILVPTTILAEQHERSFTERLSNWPVVVASLSRFKKPAEQKKVLKDLAEGKVDILVGTHRILQKDVQFKDLGLLVIDEEHRFGVSDKEKLKKMRANVDVLSLSATPIPRSLSMSMSGIRDMSIIETSPQDRLAVKTSLIRRDDEAIREAIERELARGGQVFFIHNRVKDIYMRVNHLKSLLPLVRIGVGHGQMGAQELESVVRDFLNRRIDVWVSTSIVESGLDFPSANTIVIDQADRFGLAQLYQLRGRVGRGSLQAYCYLMVDDPDSLTEDARKRLKAILDHSDLGSGYQIALHDLQIRGSGNILGSAQSGQAALVGYEMYNQLLEQTIRELKNEPYLEDFEPEVAIGLPAYLPESYAPDTEVRLVLYRRLSSAKDENEVGEIALEMRDRLGELPEETLNLIDLMELKILLKKTRIRRLESSLDGLTLIFGPEGPVNYEKIMALVSRGTPRYRLSPLGKLYVSKSEYSLGRRALEGVKNFVAGLI
jgi:transcription-repair coupling factor (superfamily II helicase)